MDELNLLGYVGECMVQLELAKKGIRLARLPDHGFDFDFLTSTGVRLEVKTANFSKTKRGLGEWRFLNKRGGWKKNDTTVGGRNSWRTALNPIDRKCDFFILVCLSVDGTQFLVMPKSEIGQRMNISVTKKSKWESWAGRWDLIENFSKP